MNYAKDSIVISNSKVDHLSNLTMERITGVDTKTRAKPNCETKPKNANQNSNDTKTLLHGLLTPAIFKLNVDCFHEIFDWLPLRDLISVGQTCKHLQRVAGDFFQINCHIKMARENNGIQISSMPANVFCQYIHKISISGDRLSAYQFVGSNCTNLIKHFRVYGVLPDGGFEYVKGILHGIEFLEMNECIVNGEFYEKCLKYCPNVKNISITRSDRIQNKSIIIGSGNEWLHQNYPNLENFEVTDSYGLQNNELKSFFKQNSKIQTFSTDSRTFWENRQAFIGTNIKLDKLAIDVYQTKTVDSNNEPISMVDCVYNMLVELHKSGFYKSLDFYMFCIDQQNINKLLTLDGIELVMGDVFQISKSLVDCKALSFWHADEILNVEHLPTFLPNVKRIYFSSITCDSLLQFIRYWPKLKQIRIKRLKEGIQYRDLDVVTLNRAREQLMEAEKILIYVKEDIYVAMKWRRNEIALNLVEIRRYDSTEWEELSARSKYYKSI